MRAVQAGSKDVSKLDALFNAYKDKSSSEEVIGPEGALLLPQLPCQGGPSPWCRTAVNLLLKQHLPSGANCCLLMFLWQAWRSYVTI